MTIYEGTLKINFLFSNQKLNDSGNTLTRPMLTHISLPLTLHDTWYRSDCHSIVKLNATQMAAVYANNGFSYGHESVREYNIGEWSEKCAT